MELNSKPLVSIVTAVYNGDKYLAECIESVLGQTYQNWEYLIVNNCSTDRTLEIAESYAQKEGRIRIHNNKKFLSAIQNFNHSLSLISPESKYCKEVHADDWLFPECLTEMVKVTELNPSVGIVGSYMLRGVKIVADGLSYPSTVTSGRAICRLSLLGGPNLIGKPTLYLIRSNLIRDSKEFYNPAHDYCDVEAYFAVLQNCDLGFVHQVLTYSRLHDEQLSSFASRCNTFISGRANMLIKYGDKCLNSEEYEKRLNELISEYYRYLAINLVLFKGKEFWEYHRNALKEIGISLSLIKLIKAVFIELIDRLLNPKRTIEKIIARLLHKNRKQKYIIQLLYVYICVFVYHNELIYS